MADEKKVEVVKAPEIAEEKKGKTNSERNREKKEEAKKCAIALVEWLKKVNKYQEAPAEVRQWLENLAAYVPGQTSAPLLDRVFGGNVKVGATVTLLDAMTKTLKGKYVLDTAFKKLAEKGVVIEAKEDADPMKTTYTIKALPYN